MIIDLTDTSTREIAKKLVQIREEAGLSTIGRVLTLIVVTDHVRGSEAAIDAANEASREHPCRVIVVIRGLRADPARLDAQIRVGGDAGAAEVVVLRTSGAMAAQSASIVTPLLLPDTPLAVWWPRHSPTHLSRDKVGRLARRRIVDSDTEGHPTDALAKRAAGYSPGDTDLAWARITHWRSVLAATLDRPPFEPITGATVCGPERAASGFCFQGPDRQGRSPSRTERLVWTGRSSPQSTRRSMATRRGRWRQRGSSWRCPATSVTHGGRHGGQAELRQQQ